MVTRLRGMVSWSGQRDQDFHRTYKIKYRVVCDPTDGPANVLTTAGLPVIGQAWFLTVGGAIVEEDLWAFCGPETSITPALTNEPNPSFDVEFTFSTKPWGRPGAPFGNPTLEPPKITFTFNKNTVEAYNDRFGNPIVNSAWERMRGKHVEFDTGTVTVKIQQNISVLDLGVHAAAYQTVNAVALWGMPPRTIKLGGMSITEAYYGQNQIYYQRDLEFEVNYRGWDRDLLDEGTKVLYGHFAPVNPTTTTTTSATTSTSTSAGATTTPTPTTPPRLDDAQALAWLLLPVNAAGDMPDPNNPMHFIRYTDPHGNVSRVVLNGHGVPAGVVGPAGNHYLCVYANTGVPLTSRSYWVPVGFPLVFSAFDPATAPAVYNYGDLVFDPGNAYNYVVIEDIAKPPPTPYGPSWQRLPSVTSNTGNYSPTATYNIGDVVRDTSTFTSAGYLHIEYYNATDFVASLGIPASLTPVFPVMAQAGLLDTVVGGGGLQAAQADTQPGEGGAP